MIIVSDEMKDSMNNYSVQFLLEFSSILWSILPDTVYTDEEITGKSVTFAVIKSYDIGEVIVLKIFLVYIQYIIVGTEDDRDLTDSSDLAFSNKSEPAVIQSLTLENEVCILKIVRYHIN